MKLPSLEHEIPLWRNGFLIIGIDEVGRGAFAGPLVAAGVVFHTPTNKNALTTLLSYGINDSKKLTANHRELLAEIIQNTALAYHISTISVAQINRTGIGKATHSAMEDVVDNLVKHPSLLDFDNKIFALIDGLNAKNLKSIEVKNQKEIIRGDSISLSIAAASIIAKVYRDKHMIALSAKHPEYNWEQNKGYGTLAHRNALKTFGSTRNHRKEFIKNYIA